MHVPKHDGRNVDSRQAGAHASRENKISSETTGHITPIIKDNLQQISGCRIFGKNCLNIFSESCKEVEVFLLALRCERLLGKLLKEPGRQVALTGIW